MVLASRWWLTGCPHSKPLDRWLVVQQIKAGGLLVGWSAHMGSPTFPCGKTPRCLSLGRGAWLVPSYNWVRTYGQSGPLEAQVDRISNASSIIDTWAWWGLMHTMAITITLDLWGIFYLHQEVGHAILGLLGVSPNLKVAYGKYSPAMWYGRSTWSRRGQMLRLPQRGLMLSLHLSSLLAKISNLVIIKSLKEVKSDYWK